MKLLTSLADRKRSLPLSDKNLPPEILTSGREKQEKNNMDSTEGQKVFTNYLILGQTPRKVMYGPKDPKDMAAELSEWLPGLVQYAGCIVKLVSSPEDGSLVLKELKNEDDLEKELMSNGILIDFKNKELDFKVRWKIFSLYYKETLPEYKVISKYPFWPNDPAHLIVGPPIVPAETGLLDRFLDFFNPLTPFDRILMKAMLITPCSGLLQGKRPLFIIAGEDGADSTIKIGKSTFAKMVGSLHESFADIHVELQPRDMIVDIMQNADKRVQRFDNVRGAFRTTIIERFITSPNLSGHVFSKGYRSFPNNTTFIMTCNDPQVSDDLADRGVVNRLAAPKPGTVWIEENAQAFLEEHRIGMLQEAAYIFSLPHPGYNRPCTTRFPTWEREVLHRLTHEDLGAKFVEDTNKLKDRTEEYEAWRDFVSSRIMAYRIWAHSKKDWIMLSPGQHKIFISSAIMNEFYAEFTNTRYASSKGQCGKEVRKLCLKSGMSPTDKKIRIQKANTRGYIFNPTEPVDTLYAIVTRRREEATAIAISNKILMGQTTNN